MIIGNINDCEKYFSINPNFIKAFEWLKNIKNEPCDKVIISGEDVWGKVFEDKTAIENPQYEAHRKYIDIHYIIEGREDFAWSDIEKLNSVIKYDADKDIEFFEGEINKITMSDGEFYITFPEDAHIVALNVKTEKVLRALVKIKI